ncbi:hypothetical protein EYC98_05805 [Halieaceae bacterium IMCC14734]|uniref:DUF3106 domain-containing protein n=1 Tax=Candidatus Litorirhabdus singularis TaxID=2518993 RepID=A0ABT3TDX5_9GAMM|nr:hypothetical protein [Candidatus Litorirhabdus singularis]MCX2980385.1 hypothetical protein [Candidatus Litorirhabdus singularis]
MISLKLRLLVLLPLTLLLLFALSQTVRMGWAELQYSAISTELSFWRRQSYQPQPVRVNRVRQQLTLARRLDASHPDYLQAAAELLRWQALWATDPQLSSDYLQRSFELQWRALTARPGHRRDWSRYLREKARLSDYDARWQRSRQQLQMLDRSL